MKALAFGSIVLLCLRIGLLEAQSPPPDIVVQAASPASATSKTSTAATASTGDASTMRQILIEMRATNAATIKKQEAALQALDELQKAADEIKTFSKRG